MGLKNMIMVGTDALYALTLGSLTNKIKTEANEFMDEAQIRAAHIQRAAIKDLYSGLSIGATLMFFVLAGVFFLIEYMEWTVSLSLLSGGIIMGIITFIIKNMR